MFPGESADSTGAMLHLAMLLSFATIALGQASEQPAYVSIEINGRGDLSGTLTVAATPLPAGLPAAFARALGCDVSGLANSPFESRIRVRCAGARPSALTFHAAIRLDKLTARLIEAGIERLDLVLITPPFRSLRLDPAIAVDGNSAYHHAHYSLDRMPPQIVIDGGYETGQARTFAVASVALILAPFLLLVLRPSDPLRLRVYVEGIFVLGWICWIWVLFRMEAGAFLSYLFGNFMFGPFLALLAPALAAVWIGSRLAAVEYARITPNALGADDYRRMRFWSGAAVTCLASTLLNLLLVTLTETTWSLVGGFVLTFACVYSIRRIGRGGSHSLSQGDLHARAFALAARAGVNLRSVSILTSPTPRPPIALATRWGVVLLNQGLLKNLSRREVDAIVCHELSHIGPVRRSGLIVVYVVLVAAILGSHWIPNFADFIPVSLLGVYFLIKAWRRARERQADLDSVRWSGDAESLITGLARVSQAHGMPMEWGAPISWMMGHPPTMDRIRAIARAGGVKDSRVAELLEESQRESPDHYVEAQDAEIPEDAAFSPTMRRRLQTRLTAYALVTPVALGLPASWLLERIGLEWWAVLIGGSLIAALTIYLGSEWIVGAVRDAVKQRALARHGQGVFAGFSPAAEPRVFDGMYQYDLGMVRLVNGALEFAGDRVQFTLDRRLVERVWLGEGPRHWTRRRVVYIECRPSPEVGPVIFSLQSFEAWFWPSTTTMAKRLYNQVEEWHRGLSPSSASTSPAPPPPCPLPRVEGNPNTFISFRTAVRSVVIYWGIGFFLASLEMSFDGAQGLFQVWCPAAVCGVLALFLVWPRLNWGQFKTVSM